MKSAFSLNWLRSSKPRKQIKFRLNAPQHIRGKFLNGNLSKELRQKYGRRTLRVRKGDKVKVMRGQFKGKTGTVEKVSINDSKIFVSDVNLIKKDGSKKNYPLEPSNLMITTLSLEDKKRVNKLNKRD